MKNIIDAIEKQLQAHKDDLLLKDIIIKDLKEQLTKAEAEIGKLRATVQAVENYVDNKQDALKEGEKHGDVI